MLLSAELLSITIISAWHACDRFNYRTKTLLQEMLDIIINYDN